MLMLVLSAVAFATPGATCSVASLHCGAGETCIDGACYRPDGFVEECLPGETAIDGVCEPNECVESLDCDLSDVCVNSMCVTDTDADGDRDGIPDNADNCTHITNAGQDDYDGDTAGDACDPDDDGDGVEDNSDNCPMLPNADQADLDANGLGDACDGDDDGDGAADDDDNCPDLWNPSQDDTDGDGQGDDCDLCLYDAAVNHLDTDNDGIGNVCDPDDDGDCVMDDQDNCPTFANEDQADADGDGRGDACDMGEVTETEDVCELLGAIDDLADDLAGLDASDCCEDSGGEPGACGEATCLSTVCAIDSYCCDTSWDDICANIALNEPDTCSCSPADFDYSDLSY